MVGIVLGGGGGDAGCMHVCTCVYSINRVWKRRGRGDEGSEGLSS